MPNDPAAVVLSEERIATFLGEIENVAALLQRTWTGGSVSDPVADVLANAAVVIRALKAERDSALPLSIEAQAACLWLRQRANHEDEAGRRAAKLIERLAREHHAIGALADQAMARAQTAEAERDAARELLEKLSTGSFAGASNFAISDPENFRALQGDALRALQNTPVVASAAFRDEQDRRQENETRRGHDEIRRP